MRKFVIILCGVVAILLLSTVLVFREMDRTQEIPYMPPVETEHCYFYVSEAPKAYFTYVYGMGFWGQVEQNGDYVDILYSDELPRSNCSAIWYLGDEVLLEGDCYKSTLPPYGNRWFWTGTTKYVEDGMVLKTDGGDYKELQNSARKLHFIRYDKDKIDLLSIGFTRVYDYDDTTGVITITGIDGTVETYERG